MEEGWEKGYEKSKRFYTIKKGTEKEELFFLKCFVKGLVHNFDLASDILYIMYVPTYHPAIKVLLVLFMLPPPIISLGFACEGELNMKESIAAFLGVGPLYQYIYEGENRLDRLEFYESSQGFAFILEDGP